MILGGDSRSETPWADATVGIAALLLLAPLVILLAPLAAAIGRGIERRRAERELARYLARWPREPPVPLAEWERDVREQWE